MDRRSDIRDEESLAAERAVEWLHRLQSGDKRDKVAFRNWLIRSPQNGGEVLAATATDVVMRELLRGKRIDVKEFVSAATNVHTIGDDRRPREQSAPPKRLRRWIGLSLAATLAALALTAVVSNLFRPTEYITSTGEQRAIVLPDGSAIAINTESTVRVAFSRHSRDVYLDRGQAMFTVAKDSSRPFRVHIVGAAAPGEISKDTIVKAIGTKFDVRRRSERINVAVIEGIVQVRSDVNQAARDGSASVVAGQGVNVERSGEITPPRPINPTDVSAWQQRRLVFTDSTLEEIAEEFRRYNRTPRINIVDENLRKQRISGVFDADSPEALLLYLQSDNSILIERKGAEIEIRMRPTIVQSAPAG